MYIVNKNIDNPDKSMPRSIGNIFCLLFIFISIMLNNRIHITQSDNLQLSFLGRPRVVVVISNLCS